MKKILFMLNLGGSCNLACSYCHQNEFSIQNNDKFIKYKKYSNLKIDRSLDFSFHFLELFDYNYDIQINLVGGEPFIYYEKVIYFIDLLNKSINNNIHISISTNGTVINEKLLYFLNNSRIKIILDITWHIEYDSKFDKISELFILLKEKYNNIEYKSTIVISKSNCIEYSKILSFLSRINKDSFGNEININYDGASYWNKKESINILKFFEIVRKNDLNKNLNLNLHICGCSKLKNGTSQILLLPNGDIFFCPFLLSSSLLKEEYMNFLVGNIKDYKKIFDKITNSERKKLYCCNSTNLNKKKCYFLHKGIRNINSYLVKSFGNTINYFQ